MTNKRLGELVEQINADIAAHPFGQHAARAFYATREEILELAYIAQAESKKSTPGVSAG